MNARLKNDLRQIGTILKRIIERFKKCEYCGEWYYSGKKGSKTCRDSCTQAAFRAKRDADPKRYKKRLEHQKMYQRAYRAKRK